MGALEYEPSKNIADVSEEINIDALTKLSSDILSEKQNLTLKHDDNMIAQGALHLQL